MSGTKVSFSGPSRAAAPICYSAHMSMIVFTALALLAGLLQIRKRRLSGFEAEPLPAWQPRVAIIVLGEGVQRVSGTGAVEVPLIAYGRVLKGLDLYLQCKHAGKACALLVSGGDPAEAGVSEAIVYGDALLKVAVDPSDLVLEGRSLNTWQNAQYCSAWLD
jgi:uncharacterized SAM-binding protein YcdF (DUF218 family)